MRKTKKSLAILLVFAVVFTLAPAAFAEEQPLAEQEKTGGLVIDFMPLEESAETQTAVVGDGVATLTFPEELVATLQGDETANIPVLEWNCISTPEQSGFMESTVFDLAGKYIFEAKIGDEWILEDSFPPTITVAVTEADDTDETEDKPGVTITITGKSEYSNALYLDAGVAVTNEMLLAGVKAEDENGVPMTIEIADTDGLNLDNPQPKGEPGSPEPYTITYTAKDATAVRDCYVTPVIMKLASDPDTNTFDITEGNITIGNGTNAGTLKVTYGSSVEADNISANAQITITGTGTETTNTIKVNFGIKANITLADVNIDVSTAADSTCALDMRDAGVSTLTLSGNNTLKSAYDAPGIYVPNGNELTIAGTGSLDVTGGTHWPGIGRSGGNGNIVINGGTIIAQGGENGAGIGGSNGSNGGIITISGIADVTAIGGVLGAGIGGGNGGSDGDIKISGGMVDAQGGSQGAGIGSGNKYGGTANSNNGSINISGGTVNAVGGYGGAGIGGAVSDHGGTITITGGRVTSSHIGVGTYGNGGTTTISGGTVNATSSSPQPTNGNSSTVYLNTLTLEGVPGNAAISAGSINAISCAETPNAASGIYGIKDVKTDNSGKVYFWLPESAGNQKVSLTSDGQVYNKTYLRAANNGNAQTLYNNAEPPSITAQPSGAEYNLNDSIISALSVTASVTDGGGLSYQWYSNGTNSSTNGQAISGATAASYQPSTANAGTTYYYCVVTNTNDSVTGSQKAVSTASGTASIRVNRADPGAIDWPDDLTSTYGQTLNDVSLAGYTNSGGVAGTFAWDNPSVAVGNVGNHPHSMTFTPTSGNYNPDTQDVTIEVEKANQIAPTGLGVTDETAVGNDGTITGVTTAMEYKPSASGDDAYTTVSTNPITNLAPGEYHVRYKSDDNHNASLPATVTVDEYIPPTYTVTLNQSTGGTATATPTSATAGTTVTLDTTLNANYSFVRWDVAPVVTFTSGNTTTQNAAFTMPSGNVTVTPVYQYNPPTYALTVTNGTDNTNTGPYTAGTVVSITAGPAPARQVFDCWTGGNGGSFENANSTTTTFTMPGNAATVTATYKPDGSVPTDASISPSSVTFDKNTSGANYKDIAVTLSLGDYSFSAIKNGGYTLQAGTDYTVSGSAYTVKKEYLATLNAGAQTLTFDMSGGADPALTVTITDTTPIVYPVNTHFGTWAGSGTAAAKADADSNKFVRLRNGSTEISVANYTVTEGSTVITLHENYLKTLANGTYTFRAEFTDGYADMTLTVNVQAGTADDVPQTGDNGNMTGWLFTLLASVLGMAGILVWRKRQQAKGMW